VNLLSIIAFALVLAATPAQSKAERDAALRRQSVDDMIERYYDRLRELDDDRKAAEAAANDDENRAAMVEGGANSADPTLASRSRSAATAARQSAANNRARVRQDNDEIISITRTIKELEYGEAVDDDIASRQSAADPLIGKWILNRAKSTFESEAPRKEIRITEPTKGGIHVIDTATYSDGRVVRSESTMSISRVSDHYFNFKIKENGRVTATGQIVCSPDGKSQTIVQSHSTTAWDRQ